VIKYRSEPLETVLDEDRGQTLELGLGFGG